MACVAAGLAGVGAGVSKLSERFKPSAEFLATAGGSAGLVAGGLVGVVAGERVVGAGLVLAGVALFVSFRSEG